MRKAMTWTLIGAAALIGTAAIGQAGGQVLDRDLKLMDQWLGDKQAGPPVSCIPQRQIRSTHYVGDRTILYKVSNTLVYRNDPAGGCPGLNSSAALITRTPTGQLCRGDIAHVRDFGLGFSSGSCALSEFVPYRRVR